MSFFTWLGVIVAAIAFLAWFIPTLAVGAQFWHGMYTDLARFKQRRRDKTAAVK